MSSKEIQIHELLTRAVDDIVVRSEFEDKLRTGKSLRVKFGVDPTGDKLHIGHAVVYWKLRAFQDLGHQVIILLGDYTAVIGDNSDKLAERQTLGVDDVKKNMKTYLKQIGKIIDLEKAEVRYNSEWLKKLSFLDLLELSSEFKVAQMLERENFRERYAAGKPIGLQEFLYPMMQGYDSVALRADVELGGTDQLFNMMAGRLLQKRAGQAPQSVMTIPLLVGADGQKMSKSLTHCVFITDEPVDMYGKIMAINDEHIPHYYRLATDVGEDLITEIENALSVGDNPRDTKASLARSIVARYHGVKVAEQAEASWNKQFRQGETPDDVEEYRADDKELADSVGLIANAFGVTKSEVRRLVAQGAIKLDGVTASADEELVIRAGVIVQLGKRRFKKILV